MTAMPPLLTSRLIVRPFILDDLDAYARIHQEAFSAVQSPDEAAGSHARLADWLRWTVANYVQLAELHQPPYGDRAVTLRDTGEFIGACGLVPCLGPFDQIPEVAGRPINVAATTWTAEVGLFYHIAADHRRHGYAVEAAQALINYAFGELHVYRIIATTNPNNDASIGVMRRLGMHIGRNPFPDPPWLQVAGVLANPASPAAMH